MTEPYWQSPTTGQRLYRFTNGRGASVVKQGNTFELAVTRITGPQSYRLDHRTPFGPPKNKLTEEQVQKHLAEIEDYPSKIEVEGGAGVEGFPKTTAKGPPPGFGEGLKGMDWEAAMKLLSWFEDVGDANIHGEMAAVVATKLCLGFLLMPVESAKPSAGLLQEISTEILRSDPMTLSAISNLHDLLVLMPRKTISEIHRLASDAITKAREDGFLEAVF